MDFLKMKRRKCKIIQNTFFGYSLGILIPSLGYFIEDSNSLNIYILLRKPTNFLKIFLI